MSTAAELLNPEVLASIKAEFHNVFMQKRDEVRKLRVAMRVSGSARSERNGNQAANEDGGLAGTKRSREAVERPIRPLKRPRIIEDVPETSSDATREPCYRDFWENHAFVELSPTRVLQAVRKIRIGEEMYESLRNWKEVERGMAAYEYVFCTGLYPLAQIILIASINAIEFVKLIASGLAISGVLCLIAMKRLPLRR